MSHDDERSLFLQEVADVRPLCSDHLRPPAGNPTPTEAQLARRQAASAERLTLASLSMEAAPMLDPHDLIGFKRDGVQEGVYKKLRLGKYELQGCLDLHQKTLSETRQALVQFLLDCELRDIRCLLILHGKGERSSPRPCQRLAAATAGGDGHPQRRVPSRRQRRALRPAQKERAQAGTEPRTSPAAPRLVSTCHLVRHPRPGW